MKAIRLIKSILGASFVITQVSLGHAASLSPGNSIAAPGEADLTGTLSLLDTMTNSFSTTSFTGSLISSVYSGDTSNPYSSSDLTFTYELLLTSGPDAASAMSIGSFAGFLTDVSYETPAIGLAPATISRNPIGSQAIRFDFTGSGYLTPGHNSALLVVQTDSSAWTYGNATVLDSTGSPNVSTFAPVPEPSSFGLAGLGLAAFAGYRCWKNNRIKARHCTVFLSNGEDQ